MATPDVRDGPDPAAPDSAPSRMDRIVVVVFVLALLTPGFAWLLGVRPDSLEARTAAPLPAIGRRTLLEPATYAALDRFIADRFAFRSAAVRLHAAIDFGLLGGSTNPDVIVGKDRWLFSVVERDAGCPVETDDVIAGLDEVQRLATEHGREFRYVLVPDKQSIYPDRIQPGTGLGAACTDRRRATMAAALTERSDYAIELWGDLTAARGEEPDRPVYFTQDTHWTPFGSLIAIRRLVTSLDPDVWDEREVTVGPPRDLATDLSRLMGLPTTQSISEMRVRPDVVLERGTVATDIPLTNAADIRTHRVVDPTVPAIEGRTLVVYDSYFANEEARIAPWFRDSVWVHIGDLYDHPELADDLGPVDRVVLERVERFAYNFDPAELLGPIVSAPR